MRGKFERGDLDWRERAACTDEDPELFFPEGTVGAMTLLQVQQAASICHGCEVRWQCAEFALRTRQRHGVWGGIFLDGGLLTKARLRRERARAELEAAS